MKAGAVLLALIVVLGQGLLGASALAQPLDGEANRLRLDITEMTPRMLDTSTDTLTVTGRVTNIGDRRISGLKARIQLGERQTSERQFSESLAEPPPADASMSPFIDLPGPLEPGQSAPLRLEVPVDGSPGGVAVSRPGVYPMLVNVNGTPDYGGTARLAELNMMLPVLGVPGGERASGPDSPADVSMLWPIADTRPRVVSAPLGQPLVLADDELAGALAPGGRLDALVTAAEDARADPQVFGSLCFAVDVDLLTTVQAMAGGYRVRVPGGTVEGKGAAAAGSWLQSLRTLVRGGCVIRLPFADADLSALAKVRVSDRGLATAAVDNAATIVDILKVQPQEGVIWPDGGLDEDALREIRAAGTSTVIVDPARLNGQGGGASELGATGIRAQPYDSLLARSLGDGTDGDGTALTPADEPNVAAQNGLAALAFRTGLGEQAGGRPVLLAPPHQWTASAAELSMLLNTLGEFTSSGRVNPVRLSDVLDAPAAGGSAVGYQPQDVSTEVPGDVVSAMSDLDAIVDDLRSAMAVDATAQVEPDAVLAPLRSGVLRTASTAWPTTASRRDSVVVARAQVDALRNQVTVVTPGQPIQLASGASPLPVFLQNKLPVAITVRIKLANNAGLRPESIPDPVIPANSGINRRIPAEAQRAGRFTVYVSLTTPEGTQLGPTARFDLTSNEYGVVTVIITATAGGALLLLAGRRIYRRVRAEKRAGRTGV